MESLLFLIVYHQTIESHTFHHSKYNKYLKCLIRDAWTLNLDIVMPFHQFSD